MSKSYKMSFSNIRMSTFVKVFDHLNKCNRKVHGGWLGKIKFATTSNGDQVDLTIKVNSKAFDPSEIEKRTWDPSKHVRCGDPSTKDEFEERKKADLQRVQDNIKEHDKLISIL